MVQLVEKLVEAFKFAYKYQAKLCRFFKVSLEEFLHENLKESFLHIYLSFFFFLFN